MALASAYAKVEDYDSALRVYRRIIKKPTTSETMLKMIWDDLSELGPRPSTFRATISYRASSFCAWAATAKPSKPTTSSSPTRANSTSSQQHPHVKAGIDARLCPFHRECI